MSWIMKYDNTFRISSLGKYHDISLIVEVIVEKTEMHISDARTMFEKFETFTYYLLDPKEVTEV